jgi:TonB-linked SusC/RagA family outer membrane protein
MELKIAILIIMVSVSNIFATLSYSQVAKVSLDMKNATLEQVMDEIEGQSEFYFVFNQKQIDVNRMVSIQVENKVIADILPELFNGTSVNYVIFDRKILLTTDPLENNSLAIASGTEPQQQQITGTVTDEKGNPLTGVTVLVKGTSNGTLSDASGKYVINNAPQNATIVLSFIGMTTQEIPIEGRILINVVLKESAIGLEEVVVIGYGTQKKVNLTGSVATVSTDLLGKRSVTQSSQLLQGAVSGVTVTQSSGEPGKDQSDIIIRGLGTFSGAGNNPLVLVDGIPSSINSVSPNDIKSISVLKDAASASIFGSRAANGVILITTKEGEEGKLQVSYESYVAKQEYTQLPQYVDSWTYAEMLNEARNNEGLGNAYTQEEIDKYKSGIYPDEYPNKHHVRDLFNSGNGFQTKHNISVNGTQGGTQYLFSTGYLKQNGIIDKIDYERYDYRLNLTSKVRDNLKLYAKLSGNFSTRNEPSMLYENSLGGFDAILRSAGVPAIVPGEKSDGTYGTYMGQPTVEAGLNSDSFFKSRNTFFMNNFSFEWNIINSLKFTGRIAYDWAYSKSENFGAIFSWDNQTVVQGPSKLQVDNTTTGDLTLDSYFDYDKTFGINHYLHVLAGFSNIVNNYESLAGYRENSPSTQLHVLDAFASQNQTTSGSASTVKLTSFFGRVNYRFKEKYLLEGNLRYDGSSRFPEKTRFGLFPSFSAAWIISKEDFFKIPWITNLKIRSSYGVLGNQQIGTYPYQKTLNINQPYPFGEQESLMPGIALTTLPFENITWESVAAFDQGIDISMFNNTINLSVDYYNRKTSDILYNLTVSSVLGMGVSSQNAGKVENNGWDFELTYKKTFNDFSFSLKPNFSVNSNKVISLAGVEKDISQGLFVGEPLGAIYGYKTDGLFIDQNDIDNYAVQNYTAKPGLIRYKDISGPNGVPDGIVSAEYDRTVIGSTSPKYSYGMGIQTNYKSFDFYILFQGLAGFEKPLNGMQFAFFNNGNLEQWQVDNRWTLENPDRNAAYPRLTELSSSPEAPFGDVSEYWLRGAGFLRIKTFQLGYSIPSRIIKKTFIDQFRVYVSGQNIITWDKYYTGWDPEMAAGGYASSSYYPPTRLWIVGINVNF